MFLRLESALSLNVEKLLRPQIAFVYRLWLSMVAMFEIKQAFKNKKLLPPHGNIYSFCHENIF